ncbi:MAG: hypothetical protein RR952_06655 [Cetobacterium sp.]
MKFNTREKEVLHSILEGEINVLARRIVNAPTKAIREEHEKQRNRLIGIIEKFEKELNIITYI